MAKAKKVARKVQKKVARKASAKGKAAAKPSNKAAAKPVKSGGAVPRKTIVVKDSRDKAFKKGPGFHKQTWFRPEGVTEPGLNFVGYEIADNDTDFNQFLHYDQLYTIRHGQNSKFFRSLLKGKLVGTKCPKCGTAWVPPRTNCWDLDCDLQETKWVEFPLKAKVHTWTVAGWSGRSSLKKLPFVLVYAKIEGSTVAIANYLYGVKPWEAEFGMPLKVVFVPEKERVGAVTDFHFEPADGWKPGPMTKEKERIKKLVAPIYEWVKTMK